jgi:hypothetical protein
MKSPWWRQSFRGKPTADEIFEGRRGKFHDLPLSSSPGSSPGLLHPSGAGQKKCYQLSISRIATVPNWVQSLYRVGLGAAGISVVVLQGVGTEIAPNATILLEIIRRFSRRALCGYEAIHALASPFCPANERKPTTMAQDPHHAI